MPGATTSGDPGRAKSRTPGQPIVEKSDALVVPGKPSNKGPQPAEMVEGRSAAKGNAEQDPHPGRRAGIVVCRWAWKAYVEQRVGTGGCSSRRFCITSPQLLVDSFYSLQKNAAAGVDGVTWREYDKILPPRVTEMHRKIHTGAYRATPSRPVYIPKADVRQRPLGIASIEDKVVQQATRTSAHFSMKSIMCGYSVSSNIGSPINGSSAGSAVPQF